MNLHSSSLPILSALAGIAFASSAGAQTQALIDFGNQSAFELASTIAGPASDSGVPDIGNPTTATPPTYNNISYGGTAYRAKADYWDTGTQQGTLGLVDTAGSSTGWAIELEVLDQGGTVGRGGDDHSGVFVGDAPSVIKDNYAQTAWEDLLFLQTNGLVTVSITGLDNSKTYDLLFYGSRTAGGTQTWSLTKGTGGSNVVHGTANNTTTAVDWTGISTDGSGEIEFTISASGGDAALNFGSITQTTPSAIAITSFTATPDTLADTEDPVTFDWTITGGPLDSLEITPGNIDVLGQTSYLLDPGPDGTTEYTLTATKGGDTVTSMVTVTLPAPEITSFTASPSSVLSGESVTLSWQVDLPATTLTVDPGGIDVSGDTDGTGAGSITVNPTTSTTYTLTATRGTSTSTADAFARVQVPRDPSAIFFEDFNSISGSLNQTQNSTGLDFDANIAVTGWTAAGGKALHMIDLDPTAGTNYAAQIFGGISGSLAPNTLTLNTAFAANASGTTYEVSFVADATVGAGPGAASLAADGITIDILRASDDSVLATYSNTAEHGDFLPATAQNLELDSFTYLGDGTGDVYIRLSSVREDQTSFGGVIDDLQVVVDTGGGGGTFADWQSANGTAGGLDDDHDGDGVENGVEFFLGGPNDTTGFTPLPGITNTGGTLSVTWPKHGGYPGTYGTDYRVEVSTTLLPGSWTPADPGDISGDVTYTFPAPLGVRTFARLVVTGP